MARKLISLCFKVYPASLSPKVLIPADILAPAFFLFILFINEPDQDLLCCSVDYVVFSHERDSQFYKRHRFIFFIFFLLLMIWSFFQFHVKSINRRVKIMQLKKNVFRNSLEEISVKIFFPLSFDLVLLSTSFLAHLVMSLCNHALSVVCRCHCRRLCHWHPCRQHRCQCLCTALPVTALIIETSYLANICSYTPSICT